MDTQSSGLGGGHFMTVFNATTKRCHAVDARETAPAKASKNMFKGRWKNARYGWEAIAVPGELHGLWSEYKRFGGSLAWKSLIQPTIDLMKEGYPTSRDLASAFRHHEKAIFNDSILRRHFINSNTGEVYKAGEQITTRQKLIRTLEILAESNDPIEEFYRNGSLAKSMLKDFERNGGLITKKDLSGYRSIIRSESDVIYTDLSDGRRICGPPPPSGSAVTQAIIKIMDGLIPTFCPKSVQENVAFIHNLIEASKFAYAARSSLGDMDFIANATELAKNITSNWWTDFARAKITPETHPDAYYGGDFQGVPDDHGTTHISVIDKWGNAVSVTSTINLVLGSLAMSESTGILFNDQMDDFSLPDHWNYFNYPPTVANYISPGKRPMSSMSPLIVFDAKNAKANDVLSIGGAGGSTIITAVAASVIRALWFGADLKEAVDHPRLHNQLKPNVTLYEESWPKVVTAVRSLNGTISANSDWRKGPESGPAGY